MAYIMACLIERVYILTTAYYLLKVVMELCLCSSK